MTSTSAAVYAVERLTPELIAEIEPLIEDYYRRTVASEGLPPLDFDWPMYAYLDENDVLVITTARKGGVLVGVALYMVCQHPHHRTLRVAECDTIAVSLDRRGQGIGRGLYEFTEPVLKGRGAVWITNRFRQCYGSKPLFEGLGFERREQLYLKVVG